MLQQMQSNRWKITGIVLFLFFFIIFGINMAVMFKVEIAENWKEMLLILFGAFVGNLNKVVDYWFNSEDRDKMLIQKVDEEDGSSLSSVTEYPVSQKKNDLTQDIPVTPVVQEETPIETSAEEPIDEVVNESEVDSETSVEESIDEPTDEPTDDYPSDEESDIK
jgi:hypothetical protein